MVVPLKHPQMIIEKPTSELGAVDTSAAVLFLSATWKFATKLHLVTHDLLGFVPIVFELHCEVFIGYGSLRI